VRCTTRPLISFSPPLEIDERDPVAVADGDRAVGAFEVRTGDDPGLAGCLLPVDPICDGAEPGQPIGIVERVA
jgi:hypothetical protein